MRADKLFFTFQFDAPVLNVTATSFGNETLSAKAMYVPTGSEQVVGIYTEFSLDPESTAVMDVIITFPEEYSTLCLEVANCSRCSRDEVGCDSLIRNEVLALANMSFYEPGKKWMYDTKLDYQCPPGKAFQLGPDNISVNQTLACQWDQSWTPPGSNMTCIWTHCVNPPVPTSTLSAFEMHPSPNLTAGELIDINASVEYICPSGTKFANDIGVKALKAVCRPNNQWEEPVWDKCIETKYCDSPPEPAPGADFTIHSHGYMYGKECATPAGYTIVNGSYGGNDGKVYRLRVLQTSSVENAGLRTSSYQVELTTTEKGDINMMLTFSEPINDSTITITLTSSQGVTMNRTSSDTSLIIETKLSSLSDTTNLDMTVKMPIGMPEPCLAHYSLVATKVCNSSCMNSLKTNSVMHRP